MSQDRSPNEERGPVVSLNPICEFCGRPIEADDQECLALDEGRCRP